MMTTSQTRRQALRTLGVGNALALGSSWGWAKVPKKPPQVAARWSAWDTFRQQFISKEGRVMDVGSPRSQTFSEGQSYALFFALIANDKETFEKVLNWTENNLCDGDMTARLPAWLWGRRDNDTWGVLDTNSASDSDLWIAYALGEAGRLWDDRRYRALSSLISARILREETATLPILGLSLLPAAKGFAETTGRWRLNPSYMPLQLMRWFAMNEPDPRWKLLAESSLKIIRGSAPKGFVPDWIIFDAQQGFLPDLGGAEKGQGAYNAIRVYLWAGMLHAQAPERAALLATLTPMTRFVRENGHPPESIDILSGKANRPGPSGFSAAILPFLDATGDKSTLQMQLSRLQAKPLRPDEYYGQVLSLFGRGWIDGFYRFAVNGRILPQWGHL